MPEGTRAETLSILTVIYTVVYLLKIITNVRNLERKINDIR